MENRLCKKILLGLGLDSKDGHMRITKGKNFRLYGGSEETHELMQEKAVKLNEHLEKRDKTLDSVSKEEFYDIAVKIGLKVPNGRGK
ncbi:MAG: hypothetical protein PHI59_03160 [Candidatus Omnitrophica bacterium]|nr:hypothetical protein [Candidatus Omnitrophota bacterium]